MAGTIWIHYSRPRPHWYGLSEAEQAEKRRAWEVVSAASRAAGGVELGRYHVRGQNDFQQVEIWQFNTVEATLDHWSRLAAARYNEWFAFANNVGTALEDRGK